MRDYFSPTVDTSHAALVVAADNEEEAIGIAHKNLHGHCPTSDGWKDHIVHVTEVLANFVEKAYESTKATT